MSLLSIITWVLAILSLWGVILNIKKDKRCFYLWTVANIGWIFIDIKANLYAQAALFVVYTFLSIYGFYVWTKEEKKEKQ